MRGLSAVWLVAGREVRERSRSKGFRISAGLVLVAVAGLVVAPKFINPTTSADVAVVGTVPPGFETALDAAGDPDVEVHVTSVPDIAAGEAALQDGHADVVVDLTSGQLVWQKEPESALDARVRAAAAAVAVQANATTLGLSPAQMSQLLTPPSLEDRSLEPADADRGTRVAVALATTIMLFIAITMFGGFVMTSVVTEKTSRIAEVLLSQVRASQLLAGKVLGIGSLALAQLVAIAVVAFVAGGMAGTLSLPTVGVGSVLSAVGFFVMGFALYATLYGAAGALVNRQEDAQAVVYPVMLPLLAGYMVGLTTLSNPGNPLSTVLSFVPLTAPVLMPIRVQLTDVPVWQVAVSVGLCLATIWAVIVVGGRVYAGGLLGTGRRVKVGEALRSAADTA